MHVTVEYNARTNANSDLQQFAAVDELLVVVVPPTGGQVMRIPSDEDAEALYILAAAAVYHFHWQLASMSDSEKQVFDAEWQQLKLTASVVARRLHDVPHQM